MRIQATRWLLATLLAVAHSVFADVTPPRIAMGPFNAALGLRTDGTVFSLPSQGTAQLLSPAGMVDIVAGYFSYMAIRGDGTLWTWGAYPGDGTAAYREFPGQVPGLAGVVAAAWGLGSAGNGGYSVAVLNNGTVFTWGSNASGQLGDGTTVDRLTPVQVPRLTNVTAVATSAFTWPYTLALKTDGTVWGWGDNSLGQLGDGTKLNRLTPVQAIGLGGAVAVAAGADKSYAVKSDGSVWVWGGGSAFPTQVPVLANIVGLSISKTSPFGLALRNDGTLWSWGANESGQLGDGSTNPRAIPVQVLGLTNVVAVSVGGGYESGYSLALRSDGTVWGWGANSSSQLGDGTATSRSSPVQALGLTNVVAIAASSSTSLALKDDGSVWQFGTGASYQGAPVQVRGVGGTGHLWLSAVLPDFVAETGAALGSVVYSNPITVTGIAPGASIGITGGQYSVGCTSSYTSSPGVISPGQIVCVSQTVANCGTTSVATLTIAGFPIKTFSVTSAPCDLTPDYFAFDTQANVTPGAPVTSNTVTIRGIEAPAPIRISGGSYSIGCTGTFTSADGTIANEQTVCVQQVAPAALNVASTAVLYVGTALASFSVMTPPPASFNTPPRIAVSAELFMGVRTDGALFQWGAYMYYYGRPPGQVGGPPRDIPSFYSPVPLEASISGVVQASAGPYHTLAVRADGTVWAWGANNGGWPLGILGPSTAYIRRSPVPVMEMDSGQQLVPFSGVIAVAVGSTFNFALKGDGTVWAWGGSLGPFPVQGPGLTGTNAIAAATLSGYSIVFALKSDGTVWGWNPPNAPGPTGITGVAAIACCSASGTALLLLKQDGTVWEGSNQVAGLANIVAIAPGGGHSLALASDGTVWAWGTNSGGQLGDGTTIERSVPKQVLGLVNVIAIAAGVEASLAMTRDGRVFRWGLTNGRYSSYRDAELLPVAMPGPGGDATLRLDAHAPEPFAFAASIGNGPNQVITSNAISVRRAGVAVGSTSYSIDIVGGAFSVNGAPFTSSPGTVTTGDKVVVQVTSANAYFATSAATLRIGAQSGESSTFFVRTHGDALAVPVVPQVAAGDSHTFLLAPDGTVHATGYNLHGQLGLGTPWHSFTFLPVAGLADVVSIASGAFHGLALRKDGSVAAWGWNAAGQLGVNSADNATRYFADVPGLTGVSSVAAGKYHSAALKSDGTVWTWGLNANGQIGDGSAVSTRSAPVQVSGLSSVTAIAAGGRHMLALLVDGTVRAWGDNRSGQLGDGTTTQRNAPIPIPGLSNVIAIAAGDSHSLALKRDGTVLAWGDNGWGQLGDGTTTARAVPTIVAALPGRAGLIAAGSHHSLAVTTGGALYAWGSNGYSQLGNATSVTTPSPTPVAIPSSVVAIAAGADHTAALDSSRRLNVWGDNQYGQVGNRTGEYASIAAPLNPLRGDSVISTGAYAAGIATVSYAGSSMVLVDKLASAFDFGVGGIGGTRSIAGTYSNRSPTGSIDAISVSVTGASFGLAANTCPSTLSPGAQCGFSVVFNRSSVGVYSGELKIASNVDGSPEKRSLFGVAVSGAAPAPGSTGLEFPPQALASPTQPASITVTNTGSAPLSFSSVTSSSTDFSTTHDCVNVAPGASCSLSVVFTPRAAGVRNGFVTVASNGSLGPQVLTVSGVGVATSAPAPDPVRLANIATRGTVLTGDDVMIAGFIIGGTSSKKVVINVAGPSLAAAGIANALANPALKLVRSADNSVVATNDNWQAQANSADVAAIQASGFQPADPLEPAIIATLAPGAYTAIVSGVGGATGVGLVGVFEADHPEVPLVNIATRGTVSTGDDVMIAGFIIQGSGTQKLVVSVAGPSLSRAGIANPLANPQLTLVRSADNAIIAVNDDWQVQANAADVAAIQASGFQPGNPLEPAIIATLPPGAYTAIVRGTGGSTGIALVGVYATP